MNRFEQVIEEVFAELRRAEEKWPGWPDDVIHQAAIVAEEAGELVRAALHVTYEDGKSTCEDMRTEAIQTAAMALRLLLNDPQPEPEGEVEDGDTT